MKLPQNMRFRMVYNTIAQGGGTIVTSFISLFAVINIARYLKTDYFGLFTFVIFFIGLFKYLMYLIVDPIVVQSISIENKEKTSLFMGNLLIIKLFLSLATILITVFAVNILGYPLINRNIVYIGCLVFISCIFASSITVLQANLKLIYDAWASVLGAILYLGWVIIAIRMGKGLIAIVWGWVICDMFRWIFVFFASCKFLKPKFTIDLKLWRGVLNKSFPLWLGSIFVAIFFHFDILLLSKLTTNHDLGIYGAAQRIIKFLLIFTQAISITAFPLLSRLYVFNKQRFRELYYKVFDYIIIIALPITIGIFVLSERIVLALFHFDFLESGRALKILALSVPFLFLEIHCSYALMAVNQRVKSLFCSFSAASVNVLLNIILIPRYGFLGAAVAWVITHVVLFFAIFYFLYQTEKLSISLKIFPTLILINLLFAATAVLMKSAIIYYSIPLLALMYFALIYVSKCINFRELLAITTVAGKDNG